MAKGLTPEGINALPWPPKLWNKEVLGEYTTFIEDTRTDMTEPVAALLSERATTHGHIEDNAYFTEEFVNLASQQTPPKGTIIWYEMNQTARFCLFMIFHKIGRILSGNWREPDHWRDIAGYATLVAERLERGELK